MNPPLAHAESSVIPLRVAQLDPSYIGYIKDCLLATLAPYEGVLYFRQEETQYYLLISAIKYPPDFAARWELTETFKAGGWKKHEPENLEFVPNPTIADSMPLPNLAVKSRKLQS